MVSFVFPFGVITASPGTAKVGYPSAEKLLRTELGAMGVRTAWRPKMTICLSCVVSAVCAATNGPNAGMSSLKPGSLIRSIPEPSAAKAENAPSASTREYRKKSIMFNLSAILWPWMRRPPSYGCQVVTRRRSAGGVNSRSQFPCSSTPMGTRRPTRPADSRDRTLGIGLSKDGGWVYTDRNHGGHHEYHATQFSPGSHGDAHRRLSCPL